MKYPLCKINDIPNEGTKLVPFFGREVHVYNANGMRRSAFALILEGS
jgi:hypothetical protein